jgi:hypothetical protein
MSASAFSGSRVEASRAGIIAITGEEAMGVAPQARDQARARPLLR